MAVCQLGDKILQADAGRFEACVCGFEKLFKVRPKLEMNKSLIAGASSSETSGTFLPSVRSKRHDLGYTLMP